LLSSRSRIDLLSVLNFGAMAEASDRRKIAFVEELGVDMVDPELVELRTALNHLNQALVAPELEAGTGVSASLTERQKHALASYQQAHGLGAYSSARILAELESSHQTCLGEFRKLVQHHLAEGKTLHPAEIAFLSDDATLIRYLRAREFDLKKSLHMLEATLKWRAVVVRSLLRKW
jgi:hypothetical protein